MKNEQPLRHHYNDLSWMNKKKLRSIKDIVIVPADKGGRIVILNKDDYFFKMEEKLKDTTIYTEVTDPTNNIQSVLSNFTQKLFQQYKITQGQQNI
ncbi:unnamed protein product [Rotaria sp. Silwood2]|nr:unnamed protein product [Rotaria sp. Silwood2]CAF4650452.1 unnamed protein product [Rotaria sp. Silwood2]CAF4672794.1 unnamed protein product [Rotaria sp. Silwood2]